MLVGCAARDPAVVRLGPDVFRQSELDAELARRERAFAERWGRSPGPQDGLATRVIADWIDYRLLLAEAERRGIRVDPGEAGDERQRDLLLMDRTWTAIVDERVTPEALRAAWEHRVTERTLDLVQVSGDDRTRAEAVARELASLPLHPPPERVGDHRVGRMEEGGQGAWSRLESLRMPGTEGLEVGQATAVWHERLGAWLVLRLVEQRPPAADAWDPEAEDVAQLRGRLQLRAWEDWVEERRTAAGIRIVTDPATGGPSPAPGTARSDGGRSR